MPNPATVIATDLTAGAPHPVTVTVRHFAAARAAAGTPQERLTLPAGSSFIDLESALGRVRPELARVLLRCTFLHDEIAVRDRGDLLRDGSMVDVLPPFAGG